MNFLVFAGDLRQEYLAKRLKEMNHDVHLLSGKADAKEEKAYKRGIQELIRESDVLVLPTPSFTPEAMVRGSELSLAELSEDLHEGQIVFGSVIRKEYAHFLEQKGVKVHDMMASEEVAVRNAVATAEGAIAEAIGLTLSNLHDMNVLVIGYGRCGSVLAQKLKGLCREVCVSARRAEVCTKADVTGFRSVLQKDCEWERYNLIFNTVPAMVLREDEIVRVRKDCVIIDLASAPGGIDYESCKKLGITAKLCSALPGKYAPETSGTILAEEIERSIPCRK